MLDKIPDRTKTILITFLPMAAIIMLMYFVGDFGFSKISDIRRSIAKSQRDQTVLNQKLGLIRTVTGTVEDSANAAVQALPDSNPSITAFAQIKELAGRSNVLVTDIKSGAEVADSSGLSRVDISFTLTGGRGDVILTIVKIPQLAPILLLDKVKLSEAGGQAQAGVTVKAFWSPFPTQLPALTDPISALTEAENKTLTDVQGLIPPAFASVSPQEGAGKDDPFTQ